MKKKKKSDVPRIYPTIEIKVWKIFQEARKHRHGLFSKLTVRKFSKVHSIVLLCCTILKLRIIFFMPDRKLFFPSN